MVLNDDADVGLMPYHRQLDGLHYIHLYSDICRLYCSHDNPLLELDDAELTDEMINRFTTLESGVKQNEEAYRQLSTMSLKGRAYFYETRLALILSGKFIAFLPETYAETWVASDQLKCLGGPERCYTLGNAAVTKKSCQPNKATSLFIDIIRDLYDQHGACHQ